jgi:Tfp pilus assembly protein PilX
MKVSVRAQVEGAASLVVVAILLAVMAIGVVFTNRNLIFEQRTAANQYRATVALEAAEAGLEWATAMMNRTDRITDACVVSAVATDPKFRPKYLGIDLSSGLLTPNATTGGVHVACVANTDGTPGWSCSCPAIGTAPNPAAAAPATGFQPSFAVRFEQILNPAGTVRITSFGCSSRITNTTCGGDAAARVSVALGPVSGLATPPAAPLTARGTVNPTGAFAAVNVVNTDPTTNGITINAGLGIDPAKVIATTVPGTPPSTTLVGNDPSLRDTNEDQMFATYFGMDKATYKSLPTVTQLTCPCSETTVKNAYDAGARQLWLTGNLDMNANLTIGSATDPFVMVVDGEITMRGTLLLYSVIYSTAVVWDDSGGGSPTLIGSAISEGNFTGNGSPAFVYDPSILSKLRYDVASYGRIPGSWRDF